jgi:hypothetical protein
MMYIHVYLKIYIYVYICIPKDKNDVCTCVPKNKTARKFSKSVVKSVVTLGV